MNTNNKPTSRIEDWSHIKGPGGNLGFLVGRCEQHHRQGEFHTTEQRTSSLVSINPEEGWAETRNTYYTLGAPYAVAGG